MARIKLAQKDFLPWLQQRHIRAAAAGGVEVPLPRMSALPDGRICIRDYSKVPKLRGDDGERDWTKEVAE